MTFPFSLTRLLSLSLSLCFSLSLAVSWACTLARNFKLCLAACADKGQATVCQLSGYEACWILVVVEAMILLQPPQLLQIKAVADLEMRLEVES